MSEQPARHELRAARAAHTNALLNVKSRAEVGDLAALARTARALAKVEREAGYPPASPPVRGVSDQMVRWVMAEVLRAEGGPHLTQEEQERFYRRTQIGCAATLLFVETLEGGES